MLGKHNAARLRDTLKGVETMTRFSLAVLALASGVYTYLGVRGILDGSATFVFFAAIIYSAAVSVAIYAFWSFMLRFVPLVISGTQRAALFLTMGFGCLTSNELGQAFGRDYVIHAALAAGGLSARVVEEAAKLNGLRKVDGGASAGKETKSA